MTTTTQTNFPNSKTSFRTGLQGIEAAFLSGNNFWFDAEEFGHNPDQNLHVDFQWGGNRFFLIEEIGYTNGGASWASVTITKHGADEVVYSDNFHDGNGAWQTSDGSDARCEYSELTNYMLKVLRSYVKQACF